MGSGGPGPPKRLYTVPAATGLQLLPCGRDYVYGCGTNECGQDPLRRATVAAYLGACAYVGGSQSACHCHPDPDRPYISAVTTPRPSGSFIPAAVPTQRPQRRQQARQCPYPYQRDGQTDIHVGIARPFQRVLTSPTVPRFTTS